MMTVSNHCFLFEKCRKKLKNMIEYILRGRSMNLYKQQFEKLLANLKLDDQGKFIGGQIDEVIVFEKENKWHIYLSFDNPLSITDLNNLKKAIKNFFLADDVAEIEVFTTYKNMNKPIFVVKKSPAISV